MTLICFMVQDTHHQFLHKHSPYLNKVVRRNFLLLLSGPLYREDQISW